MFRVGILFLSMVVTGRADVLRIEQVEKITKYEIATYDQSQDVPLQLFKLRIEKAYWTDKLSPQEVRGQLGLGFYRQYLIQNPPAKPKAKFLVVMVSLTNTGRSPSSPPTHLIHLRDSQGLDYASTDP